MRLIFVAEVTFFKVVQSVLEKVSKSVLVFTAMTVVLSACGGSSGNDPDTGAAIGSTSSAGNDTAEDIDSNVATDTGSNGSTGSESNGSTDSESSASDIRSNTTPDTDLNAESESVQKESNVDTADETDAQVLTTQATISSP